MKNGGWVKLYRSLRDNIWMRDPDYRSVWIEMLMEASVTERPAIWKGDKIMLKPGQFTCGIKQLSGWTGVEKSKIRRIIKRFKSDAQIDYQTSNKYSLYTVLNWDKYQTVAHETTREWRTSDAQLTPPEECKNERSINKAELCLAEQNAPPPDEAVQYRDQHPTAATKKKRAIKYRIGWDESIKDFTGIEQSDIDEWRKILPDDLSLLTAMEKIANWYYHHPKKRKKNIKGFIDSWMFRDAENFQTQARR